MRLPVRRVWPCSAAVTALCIALMQSASLADVNPPPDPCTGSSLLLSVLDRPTFADSPCVTKPNHTTIELGYVNQIDKSGVPLDQSTWPQAEIRFGLPRGWEFEIFAPSFSRSSQAAMVASGWSDVGFGFRHEFGYTSRWISAADASFTVPSGSGGFGNGSMSITSNVTAGYNLSPNVGVSAQIGYSTQPVPNVNSAIVFVDMVTSTFQPYAEIFAHSRSGAGTGALYIADYGIQYLVSPYVELDAELSNGLGPPRLTAFGFGAGISL
jgi:hypothetical protein